MAGKTYGTTTSTGLKQLGRIKRLKEQAAQQRAEKESRQLAEARLPQAIKAREFTLNRKGRPGFNPFTQPFDSVAREIAEAINQQFSVTKPAPRDAKTGRRTTSTLDLTIGAVLDVHEDGFLGANASSIQEVIDHARKAYPWAFNALKRQNERKQVNA